jgi:hypothetical protein
MHYPIFSHFYVENATIGYFAQILFSGKQPISAWHISLLIFRI